MANFAEIQNGIVVRIVVISNDDIKDENGIEQEKFGIQLCNELVGPANWIQTSFNNNFRKQYGDMGFTYDPNADVFIRPRPYPSWLLNENYDWRPPIPMPNDDNNYWWDEDHLCWSLIIETEES